MQTQTLNIVFGGQAGQGVGTVGQGLTKLLVRSGYDVLVTQGYESRIRGGHNTYAIHTGCAEILAPRESIDLLIALDEASIRLHADELSPRGLSLTVDPASGSSERILPVPIEELGGVRNANLIALGVVCALLNLDLAALTAITNEGLAKKPKLAATAQEALAAGHAWGLRQKPATDLSVLLGTPVADAKRMMIDGNQAIALGAIAGGLRFCAFYPMTPGTSIPLTLIAHAEQMDLIVEQVEDEIAAINMALGASYAGAPAMVATSGGGFALMIEGVSLAGMTETPIVIAIAQRPGPATGLPTRTEQADLEMVLHAGHGEFPRAILTPGTIEDCYHLGHHAMGLAERSQGPVFILTDQYLADSFRAVAPFAAEDHAPLTVGASDHTGSLPYERYASTKSGISPRLLPGATQHLVVADSDEHTADGHLTEDLGTRVEQVEKRLRKGALLSKELIPPDRTGPKDAESLLISWGSTRGAMLEAAAELQARGESVGTLHFTQVWPLDPAALVPILEAARETIIIEGNATGQFAKLLRRETGFLPTERILRYDGLPLTPEYILSHLSARKG